MGYVQHIVPLNGELRKPNKNKPKTLSGYEVRKGV